MPSKAEQFLLFTVILAASLSLQPDGAIRAQRAAIAAPAQGGYALSFDLTGAVERPSSFTIERLRQYAPAKVEVTFAAGSGIESGIFVGVPLWDLLKDAHLKIRTERKGDLLRKYLLITGSDGYQAVLSLAEVLPDYGGEPVLVAYQRDGQPLGADRGMAQLVIPRDKRGGRYVDRIVRIELRDPEP